MSNNQIVTKKSVIFTPIIINIVHPYTRSPYTVGCSSSAFHDGAQ